MSVGRGPDPDAGSGDRRLRDQDVVARVRATLLPEEGVETPAHVDPGRDARGLSRRSTSTAEVAVITEQSSSFVTR
jgi:hypothetical protein